jgi:hypothetical protein
MGEIRNMLYSIYLDLATEMTNWSDFEKDASKLEL